MTFVFPRSYLNGLKLSVAGGSPIFNVAAGQATDADASTIMNLGSAMSKTTTAWAAGPGNGAFLDVGPVAINTYYHAFLIYRLDQMLPDIGFSASLTPTLPMSPVTYNIYRRLGSMQTDGSGNWIKFIQDGDMFQLNVAVQDVLDSGVSATAITRTLPSIPPGIRVEAMLDTGVQASSLGTIPSIIIISDLSIPEQATFGGANVSNTIAGYSGNASTNLQLGGACRCMTNTLQQVRSRVNVAGGVFSINTHGWIDRRGRDD